ncbi:hypothetical protein ACJIZ3_023486 [Penstemon smallii]|uniref:Transducin/WD40 repeat-like superfamily protein n=1 Tax=Penstemon smallii TaxID=265156 RepID=A0ABD3TPD2_9LAMI
MGEVKTWLENHSILSKSPSFSSSYASTTSHEISLESMASTKISNPKLIKPSILISHFCGIANASLNTLSPQISCLALHMTYNTLYAASMNYEINVFDSTSYDIIDSFGEPDSGSFKSISFSGNKIFTSHQDSKIRVWKLVSNHKKHQLISTLPTVKDRLFKCMVPKNYVQVRRHKQKLWVELSDTVSGLAVNSDAGLLYSVSWDKSLKVWNINTSSDIHCLESVDVHTDAVNAIVVDSVDGTVYTGCADGEIKAWKRSAGNGKKHMLVASLTKQESSVNGLALTNDGLSTVLCSGGRDGIILVWEKEESENYMVVRCCLIGHGCAVLCLQVNVNGVVVSGSSDKTLAMVQMIAMMKYRFSKLIWKDVEDYCCLAILEGHCKPVKSLVAVSGGDHFYDNYLSVFSLLSAIYHETVSKVVISKMFQVIDSYRDGVSNESLRLVRLCMIHIDPVITNLLDPVLSLRLGGVARTRLVWTNFGGETFGSLL